MKERTLSLKIIYSEDMKIVLVCDSELLGKKFIEGNKILDVSEEYYRGEEATEEEILPHLENASYISLIGERSVKLGIDNGVVHPGAVIRISGIPFAMYMNFSI